MATAKKIIADIQKNHSKVQYEEEPWKCSNGYGENKVYTTKANGLQVRLVVQISYLAPFVFGAGMASLCGGVRRRGPTYELQLRNPKSRKEVEFSEGVKKELVELRKQFDKSLETQVAI